jgi:hypothetical protein
MTAYPWLKLWIGTADDPKLRAAARMAGCHKAIAVNAWIAALEYAGEHQDRGSVKGLLPDVLAEICDTTREIAVRLFQAFRELGMLLGERIAKWMKRQDEKLQRPRTANAEAIARCRQRKADKAAQGALDFAMPAFQKTISPAADTEEEREEESPSGISESNDSESIPQQRLKSDSEAEFQGFWDQCPKKVEKVAARKAYRKARQSGVDWNTLLSGMRRYASDCAGKDTQYIKHPATWLNKGCWADEENRPNGQDTRISVSDGPSPAERDRIERRLLGLEPR